MQCNACMQRIYLHMYGIHSYVYTYIYIHIWARPGCGQHSIHAALRVNRFRGERYPSCVSLEIRVPVRQCERKTTPIKAVKRKSPHEPDMHNTWRHIYTYIYIHIYIKIYTYYTDTQDMKHIHILLWHVRWWNPHFGLIKSHPWVLRMT